MRERPLNATPAIVAVRVEALSGLPAAIDLVAEAADPRHAFLRQAWFQSAGAQGVTTLLASRADGRLLAALPTAPAGPPLLGLRAVPGSYWPYRSFPVAADAGDGEFAALLGSPAARRALGRWWRLGPVYEDDPTAGRLMTAARLGGWTALTRPIGTTHLLDMDALGGAEAWPRGSTLKKNRWFEKQLAQHGALGWRFVTGADWSPAIFDALAAIEARSWVASDTDGKDAKFLAPHHRRFWESAAQDPALAAMMSAAILDIGGRPVAFSFDLDVGGVKHIIANSYDEAFARHSPGKVLAYRNLARARERGTRLVDWGAGDGGYKAAIGARAGPRIIDFLFVRGAALAAVLRPIWNRSGND